MQPRAPSGQLALLALLVLSLATPALAQDQTAPVLRLSPETLEVRLADNESREVVWTLTNNGPTNAQASLQLDAPSGWSVTLLEPTAGSFPLNGVTPLTPQPGTQVVRILVTPAAGAADATLGLVAQGANPAGQTSTTQASLSLVYIPPPPPPPPGTPWALIVGVSAVVILVALLALYLVAATRPRLRLSALALEEPAGTRASVSVLVENRSTRVRKIHLRVRGLAAPWSGALMVPYVLLDAKSSTDIPVAVSVPFAGQSGDHCTVEVQARPAGAYPWLVRRRFSLTIRERGLPPPPPSLGLVASTPQDGTA